MYCWFYTEGPVSWFIYMNMYQEQTLTPHTFHMTVPPNATEEEMAYAEKWSYVIQLRY